MERNIEYNVKLTIYANMQNHKQKRDARSVPWQRREDKARQGKSRAECIDKNIEECDMCESEQEKRR